MHGVIKIDFRPYLLKTLCLIFVISTGCTSFFPTSLPPSWQSMTVSPDVYGRTFHSTVATPNKMIIWGGLSGQSDTYPPVISNGASYTPSTQSWFIISTKNEPKARYGHSTIWTGNEMIIWGGKGTSKELKDGAIYNPTTDKWRPIKTPNHLSSRMFHKAVWTGKKMIIWGGTNKRKNLNDGGIYNPQTNSWEKLPVKNSIEGLTSHSMIWTGSEVIIWGGHTNSKKSNIGWALSLNTNTWKVLDSNGPASRANHATAWVDKKMFILGGMGNHGLLKTAKVYHPDRDKWETIIPLSTARSGQAIATLDHGFIIWGGKSDNGPSNFGAYYNIDTKHWLALPSDNQPSARMNHSLVRVGKHLIVWGGFGEKSKDKQGFLNDGRVLNINN